MLQPFVKRFIEENIELIENNKWEEVISEWYRYAMFWDYDDTMFEQFAAVMKYDADVDFLPVTLKYRQAEIMFHIGEEVQNHLDLLSVDGQAGDKFLKDIYIEKLDASLGFNSVQLQELSDSVIKKFPFDSDSKYYYYKG